MIDFNEILLKKIDDLENWLSGGNYPHEEMGEKPSKEILDGLRKMIPEFVSNKLIPFRVTTSADEGVCLVFRNTYKIVYLEYYNDGSIGLISENPKTKTMVDNIDIVKESVIKTLKNVLCKK